MATRPILTVTAAVLVLAGCGGGSSTPSAQRAAGAPSPSSAAPATTSAAASAAPPAAAGARPSAVTGGQQQPTQQAPAATRSGGSTTASDPSATPPGRYTYDSSGTVNAGTPQQVDGTATLTVDAVQAGRQHSVLKSEQGSTEQDVVVRPDGAYLARLAMTNPAFNKEFAPAEPVLLVPDPATPGRTWSWTLTSTDGKTKAALTARITRTETLTVGGVATPTSLVESTLRLTGDVTYTGQMQHWYDAAHRLTVKDHTKGSGTFSGFAFTTDITSVLRSTRPA
jgi:hypothetical protein